MLIQNMHFMGSHISYYACFPEFPLPAIRNILPQSEPTGNCSFYTYRKTELCPYANTDALISYKYKKINHKATLPDICHIFMNS